MKNETMVAEGLVTGDMANKNMKVDSPVVKWEVENLSDSFCCNSWLFFYLSKNDNVEFYDFGFNPLNMLWVVRSHICLIKEK